MSSGPEDTFRAVRRVLDRIEQAILAVLVTGMVVLSAIQILLRNIWHTGMNWAEPLLGMALLWLTMLGALAATGLGRHLSIDLAAAFLPKHWVKWLSRLTALLAAVVCGLLAWAAGRYVGFQKEMEAGILLNWPVWRYYLIIPVVFWLMAFRFTVRVFAPVSWLAAAPEEGGAGEGRVAP